MKKLKKFCCILTCILPCIWGKAECYAEEPEKTPEPANLYAESAVLMDGSSGRILYEKNGDKFMANASTTKILTCILALENAELTEVVNVSSYAASMPDVQLHIRAGEQYYLGDLLYSLMLESHNDVAVAIAEHISGSQEEFSKLMNQKAKEIGCKNTVFLTPNGLDATQEIRKDEFKSPIQESKENESENNTKKMTEDSIWKSQGYIDKNVAGVKNAEEINVAEVKNAEEIGEENKEVNKEGKHFEMIEVSHGTTALDLALIMRYCIRLSPEKEQFLQITRTPEYSFQNIEKTRSFSCRNHNAFLNMMEGALSGKTGFTGKAGYCYVGALEREGKCYIVALLACGWPNNKTYKWTDCRKLMEYGLKEYQVFSLEELREKYKDELLAEIEQGKREMLDQKAVVELEQEGIQIEEVLLGGEEEITAGISINKQAAPVKKGQPAGKVTYYIEDTKWLEELLVYKEDVEKVDFNWCLKMITDKIFYKK